MNPAYKTVSESRIDISKLMLPSYSNFSGKIHGGYILSLMDEVAFACASRHSQTYCVTASVDTVDFRNAIEIGELVTMRASINYVGRSSMVVGIRVESEHIQSGRVKHCNSSYFTMVAKNKAGDNVQVPGLILKNEDDIRRFLKSIKRREMKIARQKEFHETDFSHTDYLGQLKHYNVKLELQ